MDNKHSYKSVIRSKFIRSMFLSVLLIFVIVGVSISSFVFYSFTSEISRNIISDRQKQLELIEDTISKRMSEVSSIAFNIGNDRTFFLQQVDGQKYSGYEMSQTLARYLVGNSFISYLAYYRQAEPDKIYTSKGELSFTDFWISYFKLDKSISEDIIQKVRDLKEPTVKFLSFGNEQISFFAYTCPLPLLSNKPQAFVLMLIPLNEVIPLIDSQIGDANGEMIIYDANGEEVYKRNTLEEDITIDLATLQENKKEVYQTFNGNKYVLQTAVSKTNGWTYISIIKYKDIISGLASKQLVFIVLLFVLVFVAGFVIFIAMMIQYKPINKLAVSVTQKGNNKTVDNSKVIDERVLLSSTFATLKDDSDKKQKFENAFHEAEAANKAKSVFLSNMSHDIRTPMNAIIGMTAIAYKHADDADYVRDCLQKVQVSSQYLLDIINKVLDMSRIESGKLTLSDKPVNLFDIANELKILLAQSVDAKKQSFTVDFSGVTHANVIVDSVRLIQVFMNILSNSVKFTKAGGSIAISVIQSDLSQKAGYGDYTFVFTDNGIGMSSDYVSHVFDTFSRAVESNTDKVEGTGLGMAIAKNIVEFMGGAISCESVLGKGTTFTVKLSLKLANLENESNSVSTNNKVSAITKKEHQLNEILNLKGRRILLVEDNNMNRLVARRILSETGVELIEAVNGQEAVDCFSNNPESYFDVILMDIQMPVMNGYEATKIIRAIERSDAKTIPIYALTANTFDDDVQRVKNAGMNGHIGKPYMPDTLFAILREAFRL